MPALSILVVGATGRLGLQLIRKASAHPTSPSIHAFSRSVSNLPEADAALCTTTTPGDARKSSDLKNALSKSKADIVIVAIGIPNSTKKDDVREASARALMDIIRPDSEFAHVKVVVVSSMGAGGTKIDIGFGMGAMLAFILRHVMCDHDKQESEFKSRMGGDAARLLIVRPTGLVDGHEIGNVALFDCKQRAPSARVDRADVARWIVNDICGEDNSFGKEICLTAGTKH